MWYRHRTPQLLQWFYPSLTWHQSRTEKSIHLTFDDGPIPEMTPLVLGILKSHKVKATFFCVGENVEKYPEVFDQVVNAGHQIGNHTQHHLDGWSYPSEEYLNNVNQCQQNLDIRGSDKPLFRPPYGKITSHQITKLRDDYEIIMWDVLSGDFDQSISPETCLNKTIKATQNGSIVIFHDNIKAEDNLKYALPKYIKHCQKQGYEFKTL